MLILGDNPKNLKSTVCGRIASRIPKLAFLVQVPSYSKNANLGCNTGT